MNSFATTTASRQNVRTDAGARLATAANVLSYAILGAGAVTIVFAAYIAVLGHSKLPFWDGWSQIDFAANEGPGHTFDWLWRQYNQHRVLIPRLFLLADLRWFRATQTSLLVVNLVLQFVQLSVLAWSMWVLGGWRGALWRASVGLAAFCLFCPSQWPSLVMGFSGFCSFLPPLFASLSCVGLLLYWRDTRANPVASSSWKYLVLSIAAGSCATYSLSNGNLVWPLLVIAAVLLRVGIAAILSIVVAAGVAIFSFFYNYTVYIEPSQIHSRRQVLTLIKWVVVYFGSSWVHSNVRMAEIMGVAGFVVLAFVLWQLPAYFRSSPALCTLFSLLLLFALATGLVTSLGRAGFGVDEAFAGRYQTCALLFWLCMALLLFGRWASLRPIGIGFVLAEVAILAIVVLAASKVQNPIAKARQQGFNINVAAVALETDVRDNEQLAWADSHPDYARSLVPYLRNQRLSVFTERSPYLLGRPLASAFSVAPGDNCRGKVESTTVIGSGWPRSVWIAGWAWDLRDGVAPSEIVFASNGTITGLGVVGDWRSDEVRRSAGANSSYIGFSGYIRDVSRSNAVDVYAVPHKGGTVACQVATIVP